VFQKKKNKLKDNWFETELEDGPAEKLTDIEHEKYKHKVANQMQG